MDISVLPAVRHDASSSAAARDALCAIVFHDVLAPLAAALGPAGDVVVDGVVDKLFVKPQR